MNRSERTSEPGARRRPAPDGHRGSGKPRLRLPLSFVVGRYFIYLLLGACITVGVSALALNAAINRGEVYPANYGANHEPEITATLAAQASFDPSAIPSAYRYAHLSADATTVLDTDMPDDVLYRAQRTALSGTSVTSSPGEADNDRLASSSDAQLFGLMLPDGTWAVLSYTLMPQWATRGMRDGLPNPQDVFLAVTGTSTLVLVALLAVRAGRVLTRKMAPLVAAADAVGERSLDFVAGRSNVAQVDDVLAAMERMSISLKASLEEQWAAEARQREQVAALTHDLKTPLTVIRGNADLLAEDVAAGLLGPDQAACAKALLQAAGRTDAYVADIIAASRGQAVGGRREVLGAAELAGRLAEQARELTASRGCELAVEGVRDLPPASVEVDAEAASGAVGNLVGNACDYGMAGGTVRLRFSMGAAAAGAGGASGTGADGELSITVEDDGPGFSAEALAHGSERFFRDDAARTQQGKGGQVHFGLGLAIASDVARAHGGTLTLANRDPGPGARVTLTLPGRSEPDPD